MGRVAVVGSAGVEESVMSAFRRWFSTAVFFTPESIMLSVGPDGISATSGKFDLSSFGYVFLLPQSSQKDFYYTLARVLEKKTRVSIPSDTLFHFWNKPVLLNKLARGGVRVRKVVSISQDVAADFIEECFGLPVMLDAPRGKRIFVSNEDTLRHVLALFPPGHMVSVQKPVRNPEVHVAFASERGVAGYYRIGGKRVATQLDPQVVSQSKKVREVLGADCCLVIFVRMGRRLYLSSVKFVPNFEMFKKVTGKDVADVMAEECTHKLPLFDPLVAVEGALTGFGRAMEGITRWICDEIGDFRSSR